MGVYQITYTQGLGEVCLYFDGGCDFACHGCITDRRPKDCQALDIKKVMTYLKPLVFEKVIFMGKEPTWDADFLPLARVFNDSYNVFISNGYRFVEDAVLDEVCLSIKAVSKELFKDFTGRDNPERVLENFKRYVNSSTLRVRAESVFIPGYVDIDEIEKISRFIGELDSSIPYRIDAYSPHKEDRFIRPTEGEIRKAKTVAESYLNNVSILHRGMRVKYPVERIY